MSAYARLSEERKAERNWIAVSAHPFTFADAVEPPIERTIEPPPALKAMLRGKPEKQTVPAHLEALAGALEREPVSA